MENKFSSQYIPYQTTKEVMKQELDKYINGFKEDRDFVEWEDFLYERTYQFHTSYNMAINSVAGYLVKNSDVVEKIDGDDLKAVNSISFVEEPETYADVLLFSMLKVDLGLGLPSVVTKAEYLAARNNQAALEN